MNEFAAGMIVMATLIVIGVGIGALLIWMHNTRGKIRVLKTRVDEQRNNISSLATQDIRLDNIITNVIKDLKGKQNENTSVAGQTPAGPEKTS